MATAIKNTVLALAVLARVFTVSIEVNDENGRPAVVRIDR